MTALMRFQVAGYVRSGRVLYPVIALALLLAVVFSAPLGATPAGIRQGAFNAFADLAAMVFPICAWAARGLLDTEPDAQRHIGAMAIGRWGAIGAGLVTAYLLCACLALLAPVYPLVAALRFGMAPSDVLRAVALMPLSALAATLVGALTSRAVIPAPARSALVLLGVCAAVLLLSLGPLRVVTVPMAEWMRAAGDGPSAFARALPALALRTLAWSAAAAGLYAWLRRTRA